MQDINLVFKCVSGKADILWKKKTFYPWIIVGIVKFFVKGKEYAIKFNLFPQFNFFFIILFTFNVYFHKILLMLPSKVYFLKLLSLWYSSFVTQ